MNRVILHSDLNNFYASAEIKRNPTLKNVPMVVCKSDNKRSGVVLAKNYLAKEFDIKTGDTLIDAFRKCRDIEVVSPHFDIYIEYSDMVRKIYNDFSDQVEPFGIDEAWIDVTGSTHLYGNGEEIANKIRERIKNELDLTVSIGVSFNKVFAKLGSDMKKPDAVTIISKENFRDKVFPLNANELLCVGKSTNQRLLQYGIKTIGDIANCNCKFIERILGKNGITLWRFANGYENSPVKVFGEYSDIKSVGNSTTTMRNLRNDEEVKIVFYTLAESVAKRLRDKRLKCKTISISVRDEDLHTYEKQIQLNTPTYLACEIETIAMKMFKESYTWNKEIRRVGVRACNLCREN
ncbi:MAG: DNA polymerase IV, partial [Oscillospiraceae bacterium]